MSWSFRVFLAAAALAGAARADAPPARPSVEVLEAGELSWERAGGAARLRGGVKLRRLDLTLRADEARWDPDGRELQASGNVLLTAPGRALLAEQLRLGEGGRFEAQGVRAWTKEGGLDLSGCADAAAVEGRGRSLFTFAGERLSAQDAADSLLLEGARLTLCDCGGGQAPPWEIRARRAEIVHGKGVTLTWPVLYVTPRFLGVDRPVPVLGLPWGYLPLGERQTGLLPPELRLQHGFTIRQPLFLALSRSWDATLAPEWVSGTDARFLQDNGRVIRGPGLAAELRWAPVEGAHGALRLHWLHTTSSAWPEAAWRPPGLERLALQLAHTQRLGDDGALVADVSVVGDPYYVADFTGDVLLRGASYRRSAVWAGRRSDDVWLSAEAGYLEPLSVVAASGRAPFGLLGGDLSTFHRIPALHLRLLPRPLLGPLRLAGFAELARFAPLRGATGDEGSDGIGPGGRGWGAVPAGSIRAPRLPDADGSERDGRWQPGERRAAGRAALRAELSAPSTLGRLLSVEPWLAASASAYAFDGARDRAAEGLASARLSGGLVLSTELWRAWGTGPSRLLHVLEPRAEWRFGSGGLGRTLPSGAAFDGLDLAPAGSGDPASPGRTLSAAPPAGYQQLRLELRSRLSGLPGGARGTLSAGQDLDLRAGRRAEAFVDLSLRAGPVRCDLSSRFYALGAGRPPGSPAPASPSALDRLAELRAAVAVGGPRAEVHASFLALGPGGSQRLAAGEDPLFDPRPLPLDPVAQGSAGFLVRWSQATLAYDLDYGARRLTAPLVPGGTLDPNVYQQTLRLGWDSPCRCWKLGITARFRERDTLPVVGLTFDLGPVGGGS